MFEKWAKFHALPKSSIYKSYDMSLFVNLSNFFHKYIYILLMNQFCAFFYFLFHYLMLFFYLANITKDLLY